MQIKIEAYIGAVDCSSPASIFSSFSGLSHTFSAALKIMTELKKLIVDALIYRNYLKHSDQCSYKAKSMRITCISLYRCYGEPYHK